jgi:hypothetical protein
MRRSKEETLKLVEKLKAYEREKIQLQRTNKKNTKK